MSEERTEEPIVVADSPVRGVRDAIDDIKTTLERIDRTAKAAETRAAQSPTKRSLGWILAAAAAAVVIVVGLMWSSNRSAQAAYRAAQEDLNRQVSLCFLATPTDQRVIDGCAARFEGYKEQLKVGQARLKAFQDVLNGIPENRARIERLEKAAGISPPRP